LENPGPETAILLDFVKELKPRKVLEVGCNFGRELKLLERLQPKPRLYGVDMDWDKIKQAKRNIRGTFKVGFATELPFLAGTFDLVYTDGCLAKNSPEHIPRILNELVRVSKDYILTIEYVGTKVGPSGIGNCKKNSHIYDYEKLWSVQKHGYICFSRTMPFGVDLFHVMLVKKFKRVKDKKKYHPIRKFWMRIQQLFEGRR